jgi:hypothetical protein
MNQAVSFDRALSKAALSDVTVPVRTVVALLHEAGVPEYDFIRISAVLSM